MSTHVLGIKVSAERLHAVLMEQTDDGPVTRTHFVRSFGAASDEASDFSDLDDGMGGFADEDDDDDFTIQFGDDGGSGGDMFLGSEFDDLDGDDDTSTDSFTEATFEFELGQILDECKQQGFGEPRIAFCSTASEIDEIELRLPPDEGTRGSEGTTGLPLPAKRKTLYAMVEEQYDGNAEKERVAFVPMRPTEDGRHRVLALIARRTGPVPTTLREMRDKSSVEVPDVQLFDAEVPVYLGMARSALQIPPDTNEKTLIVRTGKEDTLVLFMEGNTLLQAETLPSLTVLDPAETICSRVLLLQDEYGIGEMQHVLLIGEEGEDDLIAGFQDFFPDAGVHGLRDFFPGNREDPAGGYVGATGAALRILPESDAAASFLDVNFLPKNLTKTKFELPVGWSVPVLYVLLFLTSLGFVWYYLHNASDIREHESQLQQLEQEVAGVDQDAIQTRIDSLNVVAQRYSEGMTVLDSLLRGSNKWSRGLARVASQTDSVKGIWVEDWNPQTATEVTVAGYSTARPRVVQFAKRMDAEILSLAFTEIRDWPLYSFQLTVPLDTTMPDAAQYWRQERLAAIKSSSTPSASAGAPGPETVSTTQTASVAIEDGPASGSSSRAAAADTAAQSSADRWTLVIGAPRDEARAQRRAEAFRDTLESEGYTIRIRQSPTNGRYLVSVGTFSALSSAKSALRSMEAALPDGSWIYKIPSESDQNERTTS